MRGTSWSPPAFTWNINMRGGSPDRAVIASKLAPASRARLSIALPRESTESSPALFRYTSTAPISMGLDTPRLTPPSLLAMESSSRESPRY